MTEDIKILFIRPWRSSFIQTDLELLKKHFIVKTVDFVLSRGDLSATFMTLFGLITGILWADLTFSWFASGHAFWAIRLSKLFRKKSVVVVGGYEVANVPDIGYGAVLDSKGSSYARYALINADRVLTVDESLKKDAIRNYGIDGDNIQTIPTGYDYEKFNSLGIKEDLVITVGYISEDVVKRKGFEVFIKAASYLPEVRFALIGKPIDGSINHLKKMAPNNVEFPGFVSNEELIRYYQRAKVYCQLSLYEGLPNALCEAMLCECVPIGTRACGIPTAMGDTGFYVPYGDPQRTAEAIKVAIKSDKGKDARNRIKESLPLQRRERELEDTLIDLALHR